jgi:hypothetical protein
VIRTFALALVSVSAFGQALLQQNYDARSYSWSRTNGLGAGGDLSSAGAGKVISLTPPPKGVYGSSSNHYVYIYDGTGTAEAALITGGTCAASSLVSCMIIVTTANAHTGAWKVGTATAGIQEAIYAAGGSSVVVTVPGGVHALNGPITVNGGEVEIQGTGIGVSKLSVAAGDWDAISFIGTHSRCGVRDLTIRTSVGRAGGYAISAASQIAFDVQDVSVDSMPDGFRLTSTNQAILRNISVWEHTGDGILVDGPDGYVLRIDRAVVGSSQGSRSGVRMREIGDAIISDSHFLLNEYGVLVDPDDGQVVASLELNSVYGDNSVLAGISLKPYTGGQVVRTRMNAPWAASTSNGPGLEIHNYNGGTVDGVQIVNGQFYLNSTYGLYVDAGGGTGGVSNVSVSASHFTNNGLSSSGTIPGAMFAASNWQFVGNMSGVLDGLGTNSQSYGIQVYPGAFSNYTIANNDLRNNAVAPISDGGTGMVKSVHDNLGVDNVILSMASATTIALFSNPIVNISGTTTITTITGGWTGRRVHLFKTDAGSVTVGGGGNIPGSHTLSQNGSLDLTFDGTNWY